MRALLQPVRMAGAGSCQLAQGVIGGHTLARDFWGAVEGQIDP